MKLSLLKSALHFMSRLKPVTPIARRERHTRKFVHRWSQFGQAAEVLEDRCLLSTFPISNSLYRPETNQIFVDHNFDGRPDAARVYGNPGDVYTSGDFNNDGLSDSAVFREGRWFIDVTRNGAADFVFNFGQAGDQPLIGDADGDGRANLILYRNGTWLIDGNGNGQLQSSSVFGVAGDIPIIGDLNGDGRTDRGVYRPSEGRWHIDLGFDRQYDFTIHFGGAGVDRPFVGDFNDDGVDDIGIFRNGRLLVSTTRSGTVTNTFIFGRGGDVPAPGQLNAKAVIHSLRPNLGIYRPSNGLIVHEFTLTGGTTPSRFYGGASVDQVVVADFDGNTVTDTAIFRNGNWLVDFDRNSRVDQVYGFGVAGDRAAAGDLNNDGRADLVIFRNGTWFVDTNRDGGADHISIFGGPGDIPVIGDFNNDGINDRGVYRPSNGTWYLASGLGNTAVRRVAFGGNSADIPFAFDFNADGRTDIGVFRNGRWLIDTTLQGRRAISFGFGQAGDVPIPGFFDTANSVFVRAGAGGNGTMAAPFGSITQALNVIGRGGFVRIAPGSYRENPRALNQHDITLVGTSRHATHIIPPTGNAFIADSSTNIYLEELSFASRDGAANAGRGVVVFRSSLWANGIRTTGNRNVGVLTAAPNGQVSLVDIRNSSLDRSRSGGGFFAQRNSIVRLDNVIANQNGTGAPTPGAQFGQGIVLLGRTQATIRNSIGSFNRGHGFVAQGNAEGRVNVLVINSRFNNNPNVNGAIINGPVDFEIAGTTFNNNGTAAPVGPFGFNGLEINIDPSGSGLIRNSTFLNNTAFGIFNGSGTNVTIARSLFEGHHAAIFVDGVNQGGFSGMSNVLIVGNTFRPPTDRSGEGVVARGPGATVTIGGTGNRKNTFDGFEQFLSTHAVIVNGGAPTMQGGNGLSLEDANDYPNSEAPFHHVTQR